MYGDAIKTPGEVSKELETINFKILDINRKHAIASVLDKGKKRTDFVKNNKVAPGIKKIKWIPRTQLELFQNALKPLFVLGQCIGLNPVQGISDIDFNNMRFTIYSWRFLYCLVIGIGQTIAVVLSLYRLFKNSISIGALGYLSFFGTACATTFLFVQLGCKWPKLMKEISNCGLNEYIDCKTKRKCYIATILLLSLGFIEHVLSLLQKIEHIVSCNPEANVYEKFLTEQFPWYFDLEVPINIPVGIILQILNILSTINWNYLDLYIVCISMYLEGLLTKINTKIITASEKHYLPSSHWRALREDYNRATRLVRAFDDVISGLVFTSFASNLFFICLQVFNILAHGVNFQNPAYTCATQSYYGIFGGYEYTVYLLFSTGYLLARALTVSLVAASVNTASLVPAPALFSVPSSVYCDEVARFITQVNEDKIALSGLQFFYVTRDLVLSVAGTIVTYELVLLQFSSGEINK